jgi:hypothetical protein
VAGISTDVPPEADDPMLNEAPNPGATMSTVQSFGACRLMMADQ